MNFKEAEAKLAEIAGGEYHTLKYEKKFFGKGDAATECIIYIHGQGYTSDRTWDLVFQKYEAKYKPLPIEEIPEDEAMEVPE